MPLVSRNGERDLRVSRRNILQASAIATGGILLAPLRDSILAAQNDGATPGTGDRSDPERIVEFARRALADYDLRAVILHVAIDGQVVVTTALGESMTGVPATADMHFRNGAVAISLMATLMLVLVDEGAFGLDEPIGPWAPELPDSDTATFRMLANMTAGYRDFVQSPEFLEAQVIDPFRQFSPDEVIAYSVAQPRLFAPGTNWEYSHSNYVILGEVIEAAMGEPVVSLMQRKVLDPLGLDSTTDPGSPAIPEPVLHAFTSERREHLGIAAGVRFYEESTFWNPSWTITRGAIQTTTILDMARSMEEVAKGTLLSLASHKAQVSPLLIGFGEPLEGCFTCRTNKESANYGLGIWNRGSWVLQNPLFSGYSGTAGYDPVEKLSIAVAVTYGEGSFDEKGGYQYGNVSEKIFAEIEAYLTDTE